MTDATLSTTARRRVALSVSAAFVAILLFNLCYPTPRGPADNGDFRRLFPAFSSGPVGLPTFPETTDPAYDARFFRHFVRQWQIGPPNTAAQPSSTSLLFLPGRYVQLGAPSDVLDLTRNTVYWAVLLGLVLLATLLQLRSAIAVGTVSAIALLMSDGQLSMYLSSFYQEGGAYVFTLVVVCALHLLWDRRRIVDLVVFTVAAMLLAATKFVFTPSVLIFCVAVLASWLIATWEDRRRRIASLLAIVVLSGFGTAYFERVRDVFGKDVSYGFIFTGALPELAPEERPVFLAELGIDPAHTALMGKTFYDADSLGRTPELNERLGNAAHTRAIRNLAFEHPTAFVRLLGKSFARSGLYDIEQGSMLGTEPIGVKRSPYAAIEIWTWTRARWLRGGIAYILAIALCTALLAHAWVRRARDWLLLYGLAATACLIGSALQVVLAMLGNGPADLNKHQWFGNVLLDLSLSFAVAGIVYAVWRARRLSGEEETAGQIDAPPRSEAAAC